MGCCVAQETLRRELNLFQLTISTIVGLLGVGALFSTAKMASLTGPGVVLAWVLAVVFYFFIAMPIVELAPVYPEAGGPGRYPLYTHGRVVGLLTTFSDVIFYILVPPIEALAIIYGISSINPGLGLVTSSGTLTLLGGVVAAVLVLLMVPPNYFGTRGYGKTTQWLGMVKLILYLILPIGLIAIYFNPGNFTQYHGILPYGAVSFFYAVPLAAWSVGGIRLTADLSEEVKYPRRTIVLALFLALLAQLIIYTLFSVSFIGGLDWARIGVSAGNWAGLKPITKVNPWMFFGERYNAAWLFVAAAITGIVGPYVAGYINMNSGARVMFAMGRSGYMPEIIRRLHDRYVIPYWALIIFGLVGMVLAFLTAPIPTLYGIIIDSTAAAYIGLAPLPVSMIVARRQGIKSPYRLPAGAVLGALAFIFTTYIAYWTGWPSLPYATALILAASLIFGAIYRVREHLRNAAWYIAYMVVLSAITYIGQSAGGPLPILKLPWDMVTVTVLAVVFYIWGIYSGLREPYLKYYVKVTE